MTIRSGVTHVAALLLAVIAAAFSHAQPQQAQLDVLLDEVRNDASLTEERRAALVETMQEASRALQTAATYAGEQQTLLDQIERGDALVADYQGKVRDIQRAPATVQRRLGSNPGLTEIESEISALEAQRASYNRDRSRALEANSGVAAAETQRRDRLAEIATQLEELGVSAGDVSGGEEGGDLEQRVRSATLEARRMLLQREEELLQLRQRAAPMLTGIRTAKAAWLDAIIAEADELMGALQTVAAERRQTAAGQRRAETRRLLDGLGAQRPALNTMAQDNATLIDEFQSASRQIEAARSELASLRQMKEGIEQDANLTRRRLGVAGLESELGAIMLTRLESLPDSRTISLRDRDRNKRIAALSISALDHEQALRVLVDPSVRLRDEHVDFAQWTPSEQRAALQLLEQRRELLQDNLESENALLRLLVDSNQAAEELIVAAEDYENFLTANLLWVRNYSFVGLERLRAQLKTLATAIPLVQLNARGAIALGDVYFVSAVVFLLLLTLRRPRIKRMLQDMLGSPIRPRDESGALIFRALLLTTLLALPGALLLFSLARLLFGLSPGDAVVAGAATTLERAAVALFLLAFLKHMGSRFGAGRRLLKWNGLKLDTALRDLRWLRPVAVLAIIVFGLGRACSPIDSGGPLSALGSALMVLSLLIVSLRMHNSGVYDGDRLTRMALRIGILAAGAIVVMHLSGQLFAAHLYLTALAGSAAAILTVLLVFSILQRLLLINQGRLERRAKEELRAREAEETEEHAEVLVEAGSDLGAVTSLSEAYTNLLGVGRLLALGILLWLIWSPALPALDIFDSVTLWTTQDSTLPAGELRAITLSVLLSALLMLLVTVLVTTHLPPLINVLLMEWTKVSAGGRYATGMLTQYVVIGVGLSVSLGLLGFEWSKVQWLVAALGVGIGFGLQEIVANFISGLIVLFERPIRVGDIINAGGHDGTVTNINPRATVIQTFERKEVMIPNKELITSVVTNWSLSNTQLRVLVPVGVSYGSDVGLAMRILLEIAQGHPDVLEDPAPMVTFEDFGDNALILWIRCYATGEYLRVATELREQVYNRLNEEGIGIAFPQRDVHLDAAGPIPVRLLQPGE